MRGFTLIELILVVALVFMIVIPGLILGGVFLAEGDVDCKREVIESCFAEGGSEYECRTKATDECGW